MSFGVALIIIGLLVMFGSFVYAAVNIYRMAGGVWEPNADPFESGFIKRHIGAVIGIAFGMLLLAIGILLAILQKVG